MSNHPQKSGSLCSGMSGSLYPGIGGSLYSGMSGSLYSGIGGSLYPGILTIPLFDRIKEGEFIILHSIVTQDELENAPRKVKELVKSLSADLTRFIETTDEAIDLATEYISEKVVGQTSYADCLHIALATIHRADFLVSWNFKHIVNIERIRGYNAINIKNGYKQLEIRSPREFEKYEDD